MGSGEASEMRTPNVCSHFVADGQNFFRKIGDLYNFNDIITTFSLVFIIKPNFYCKFSLLALQATSYVVLCICKL